MKVWWGPLEKDLEWRIFWDTWRPKKIACKGLGKNGEGEVLGQEKSQEGGQHQQ